MSAALLAAVALVLFVSGLAHLRHFERTVSSVRSHGLIPAALAPAVVGALTVAEVGLGSATAIVALVGPQALGPGTLGAQWWGSALLGSAIWRGPGLACAALLAVLTAYAHVAATRRSQDALPCACGVGEAPLGAWVTARAALLTVLALSGALTMQPSGAWLGRPLDETVMLLCATVSLAVGATLLPAARASLDHPLSAQAAR